METLWKSVIELSGRSRLRNSLVPTAIFLAVLAALVMDAQFGWRNAIRWWQTLKIETQLGIAIIGVLFVVAIAASFDAFTPTFLRWVEGYWNNNRLFRWIYERRCTHHRRIIENSLRQFSELRYKQDEGMLSLQQRNRVQQLESLLHYYPPDPQRVMPTFLGNVIRAAEDYERNHYGLDPIVTWVRLYPSLDNVMQNALDDSQRKLNLAVLIIAQTILWGAISGLFELALGKWQMSLFVLVVSGLITYLAYQSAIQAAKTYGELIRAAFDLHRFDLYRSLHLPLPTQNGVEEREKGDILTRFLWRGDVNVQYRHIEKRIK